MGDLARALEELTRRLNDHIRLLESFAADVSHEFRNPLASIRTAAEMMAQADSPGDRERFLAMMTRDVDRLERLVSGVRELARIDGQLETVGRSRYGSRRWWRGVRRAAEGRARGPRDQR